MRVAFLGGDFWGLYFLRRLIEQQEVVGIVSSPGSLGIVQAGKKQGIPCFLIQDKKDQGYRMFVEACKPDLIVSAGFPLILKQDVLTIPPLGAINIHGSYLPFYRGPQPLEWQMINGEPFAGVTIHYMDEGIDTGNILAQDKLPILETDTLKTIMLKLSRKGGMLLENVLARFESGAVDGMRQNDSLASYYGVISEKDREIDWTNRTLEIYNLIRGLPPYAPAFSTIEGIRCFLLVAKPVQGTPSESAGQIVCEPAPQSPMTVSTSDGYVAIFKFSLLDREKGLPEGVLRLGKCFGSVL